MKRITVVYPLLCVFAVTAAAQTASPCTTCTNGKGEGRQVRWQVPIKTVPVSGVVLQVHLVGVGPESSWQVGATVKPRAEGDVRLQVAEVEMEANRAASLPRMMSEVRSYADTEIALTPGRVQIAMRPNVPARSTVVFLDLPRPMVLEITSERGLLAQARVATSLHLVDGKLTTDKISGLASLLIKAAVGRSAPQVGVQRLGPNEYFAPPSELVKNLMQFTRPPRYSGSPLPEGVSAAFLVSIGIDGEIKAVVGARGDDRLIAHCRSAVLGWRFNPFLFQGNPVPAKGSILVTIDKQGNVVIPLLEGQ